MQLLHLGSSITGEQSVSRLLTAEVVAAQRAMNPGIEVIYRDLAAAPAMHLSPAHIAVFQGAAVKSDAIGPDLALGAKNLDELFAADVIVIGAPMYNFTTPSQLKAWVDRIVVAGKTFCYTERGSDRSAAGREEGLHRRVQRRFLLRRFPREVHGARRILSTRRARAHRHHRREGHSRGGYRPWPGSSRTRDRCGARNRQ